MDRNLLLYLTPLLPVALAVLILERTSDAGSPVALMLLPIASILGILLAILLPPIQLKRNYLGRFAFWLIGTFNLLLILGIIVEVLALFSLFNLFEHKLQISPSAVWFVWGLPAFLITLQTVLLLERRVNVPQPTWPKAVLVTAGAFTFFNVLLSLNALFAESTRFLFIIDVDVAREQAVYLLLTATTLQAVVAMVLFRIPTLFELVFFRPTGPTKLKALTMASPLMFTVAFAGLALGGSLVFILTADKFLNLGGILPDSVALRVALAFPIALVTFFLVAAFLTYKHAKPKLKPKREREDNILVALQVGTVLVTAGLLALAYRMSQGMDLVLGSIFVPSGFYNEMLVLAVLSATGPLGFFLQAQHKRLRYIEERLPDFLTDLAETSKAGLPLHISLQTAARKDYGALSPHIQRMALQCSWGLSFGEAFQRFGEQSRSSLIRRTARLVVETSQAGGNTGDVLAATARDIAGEKALEADRRAAMTTYIAVIYVVFFVFMGVLAVLAKMFLPQLLGAGQQATQAGASKGLFAGSRVSLLAMKEAFFHGLLVQAAGNGSVAGLVRDGNIGVGMRHVFILVLIAYAAFRLVIL